MKETRDTGNTTLGGSAYRPSDLCLRHALGGIMEGMTPRSRKAPAGDHIGALFVFVFDS